LPNLTTARIRSDIMCNSCVIPTKATAHIEISHIPNDRQQGEDDIHIEKHEF
jgi:hypothetical protein